MRHFVFSKEFCAWLVNWKRYQTPLNHERFLNLSYEEMLEPDGHRRGVNALAGLLFQGESRLSREELDSVCKSTKFDSISINLQKDREVTEVPSAFCRKGVSRDYENYLSEAASEKIELLMGGFEGGL
ncbi:MAG: sulfotransferase domain-containing protein [Verrucomicrobiota bacterium]